MESKKTNQHVSELNVFIKMGYELVKARKENMRCDCKGNEMKVLLTKGVWMQWKH